MIFQKGFKFRLKPNREQESWLYQFAGSARWIFNWGLNQRKELYEKEKKSISLFEQNNQLTGLKKNEDTSWLKDIHSQVLQQSLHDLNRGFEGFFRRLKKGEAPGYPRFKCKGEKDSFRYPQSVQVKDNKAYLPKIGWVRFKKSREIPGEIKQTTILREGRFWYISFSCAYDKETAEIIPQDILGIDLGIESYASFAYQDETWMTGNPRFLNKELGHLRFLSKQLSKKKKKSKNRQKFKTKLSAFHAKVRNRRLDYLHKLSTKLVKSHDAVAVENLQVKSMLENNHKGLSRAISDAGWRQFLEMLRYKCAHAGKKFVETGKYFPSSQICSNCGARKKMPLCERIYKCNKCGLKLHRDLNSAKVIRAAGMSVIKACGAACASGSYEAGISRL